MQMGKLRESEQIVENDWMDSVRQAGLISSSMLRLRLESLRGTTTSDAQLRQKVSFYEEDRFFAPDIEAAKGMVMRGELSASCKELFTALHP